jgi:hypothetical protein
MAVKQTIPWEDLLDQEKREIEAEYRSGARIVDIVAKRDVSAQTVSRQVAKQGWTRDKQKAATPLAMGGGMAIGADKQAPKRVSNREAVMAAGRRSVEESLPDDWPVPMERDERRTRILWALCILAGLAALAVGAAW